MMQYMPLMPSLVINYPIGVSRAGCAQKAVSMKEFKRAKDYLLGQLMLGLEDTMDHMLWIGDSMLSRNKVKTRATVVKEFEKITRRDVKRVARAVFVPYKYNVAVIGPIEEKTQKSLCKLLKI